MLSFYWCPHHGLYPHCTVWTVDFETPVCKLYLLFITADAAQEKEQKRRKCCSPLGVSKSVAHALFCSSQAPVASFTQFPSFCQILNFKIVKE
jgi:hypothetical protein